MVNQLPNRFVVAYAKGVFYTLLTLYLVLLIPVIFYVWIIWELALLAMRRTPGPVCLLDRSFLHVDRAMHNLKRNSLRYSNNVYPFVGMPCMLNKEEPRKQPKVKYGSR